MYTKNVAPDGTVFYFNATLNKSVWKPPVDATVHEAANLKPLKAEDAQKSKNLEAVGELADSFGTDSQQIQAVQMTGNGVDELPPEWVQMVDQSSGRSYYVNQHLKLTQWEMPVAASSVNSQPSRTPLSSSITQSSMDVAAK